MSNRIAGSSLWLIGPANGGERELFVGTLHEMVAEINRLHLATGVRHSGTEAGREREEY